jgi:hypothetical protein
MISSSVLEVQKKNTWIMSFVHIKSFLSFKLKNALVE